MSSNDFVLDLIQKLKVFGAETDSPGSEPAKHLAEHLEWRLANPHRNDGWDLAFTGDAEHDRQFMADWLERSAHTPPLTAPSWTRTYSELFAWCLRHNCPIDKRRVMLAMTERLKSKSPELLA